MDDWAQASRLGECQYAVRAGLFSDQDHPSSTGEVIAGHAPGGTGDLLLTPFDATGLAIQALAMAELAIVLPGNADRDRPFTPARPSATKPGQDQART